LFSWLSVCVFVFEHQFGITGFRSKSTTPGKPVSNRPVTEDNRNVTWENRTAAFAGAALLEFKSGF